MRNIAYLPTKTRNAYAIVASDLEDRKRDLLIQVAKLDAEIEAYERSVRIEEAIVRIALGVSPEDAVSIARQAIG